jgi:hypothetical protein
MGGHWYRAGWPVGIRACRRGRGRVAAAFSPAAVAFSPAAVAFSPAAVAFSLAAVAFSLAAAAGWSGNRSDRRAARGKGQGGGAG